MNIDIITVVLRLDTYGFSGRAATGDYPGTALNLMNKMWQVVKSNGLKNNGKNIWIYGHDHSVFAGVELETPPPSYLELEHNQLILEKYAYYKHIGPYSMLKRVGTVMKDEVVRKCLDVTLPYIEIYGHWTKDESKLETELLMSLK